MGADGEFGTSSDNGLYVSFNGKDKECVEAYARALPGHPEPT